MEHLSQNHHEYESIFFLQKYSHCWFFTWVWSQYLGRNPKTAQLLFFCGNCTNEGGVASKWSFPKSVFHYLSQIKLAIQQSWNFRCCMALLLSQSYSLWPSSIKNTTLNCYIFLFSLVCQGSCFSLFRYLFSFASMRLGTFSVLISSFSIIIFKTWKWKMD